MNKNLFSTLALAAALAFSAGASAKGNAEVTWGDTASFTDFAGAVNNLDFWNESQTQDEFSEKTKRVLEASFSNFAKKNLSAGQTLKVTVTDVDLAGVVDTNADINTRWRDFRENAESKPTIKFTYETVDQSGKVVDSGEVVATNDRFWQEGKSSIGWSARPYDTQNLSKSLKAL